MQLHRFGFSWQTPYHLTYHGLIYIPYQCTVFHDKKKSLGLVLLRVWYVPTAGWMIEWFRIFCYWQDVHIKETMRSMKANRLNSFICQKKIDDNIHHRVIGLIYTDSESARSCCTLWHTCTKNTHTSIHRLKKKKKKLKYRDRWMQGYDPLLKELSPKRC